jgi:hypothetical protein
VIFRPELVGLIKEGRKTQTRRLTKAGEMECRYKPNHAYKVQPGRGQRGEDTITVVEPPRRERLGDLSLKDARREGFRNVKEFERYWKELHGAYDPDEEVWVISFIRGDHVDQDRFLARSTPKQFCTAKLPSGKPCGRGFVDDPPDRPQAHCKCGARRPPQTLNEIGYTLIAHQGLPAEPAAIPASLQEEYVKQSHDRAAHTDWEPIHGPAARIGSELSEMRPSLNEMRTTLAAKPDRQLKREVERMEKGVDLMEKALQRLRDRIAA